MSDRDYLLNFTVPTQLESPNATGYKGGKGARFRYAGYKKKWHAIVINMAGHTELVQQRRLKVRGEFVRVLGRGQRSYDYDNMVFSSKPIRDALKFCGYCVDDSPKWLKYTCTEMRSVDGKAGTIIRLWIDNEVEE